MRVEKAKGRKSANSQRHWSVSIDSERLEMVPRSRAYNRLLSANALVRSETAVTSVSARETHNATSNFILVLPGPEAKRTDTYTQVIPCCLYEKMTPMTLKYCRHIVQAPQLPLRRTAVQWR